MSEMSTRGCAESVSMLLAVESRSSLAVLRPLIAGAGLVLPLGRLLLTLVVLDRYTLDE
jgi:hypothetical protein